MRSSLLRIGTCHTTIGLCIIGLVFLLTNPGKIRADTLSTVSDTLSSPDAGATNVTHTIEFQTTITDLLKHIRVRFSTTPGGTDRPTNLDLLSTSLGTVGGIGSDWELDTSSASDGLLILKRTTAATVESGSAVSIAFAGITNSAIDDCESGNVDLTDTCAIRVWTYSDDGSTLIDYGNGVYTVQEDPVLSLSIDGVNSGETHNGVTTSVPSSTTALSFANLIAGQPKYMAHRLTVTTNAPHGYTVTAYFSDPLTGAYLGGEIDPFGATNATWDSPQLWSTPVGTAPNQNSGWFGANTSDTDVPNWELGASRFGPVSTIPHIVMTSSGPSRSGKSIYVSYAIEVNGHQPADLYTGTLIYDLQPTY